MSNYGFCQGVDLFTICQDDHDLQILSNRRKVCIRKNNRECTIDKRSLCSQCQKFLKLDLKAKKDILWTRFQKELNEEKIRKKNLEKKAFLENLGKSILNAEATGKSIQISQQQMEKTHSQYFSTLQNLKLSCGLIEEEKLRNFHSSQIQSLIENLNSFSVFLRYHSMNNQIEKLTKINNEIKQNLNITEQKLKENEEILKTAVNQKERLIENSFREIDVLKKDLEFEKSEKKILINQNLILEEDFFRLKDKLTFVAKCLKNKNNYTKNKKIEEQIKDEKERNLISIKGEYTAGVIFKGLKVYLNSKSYKKAQNNIEEVTSIFIPKGNFKKPKIMSAETLRSSIPGMNLLLIEKIKEKVKKSSTEGLGVAFEDFSTKLRSNRGHMLISYPVKMDENELKNNEKHIARIKTQIKSLDKMRDDVSLFEEVKKEKKREKKLKKLNNKLKKAENLQKISHKRIQLTLSTKPFIETTAEEVYKVYKKDFEILNVQIPQIFMTDEGSKELCLAKLFKSQSITCKMHKTNTADKDVCTVVFECDPKKSKHLRCWRLLSSKTRSKSCIFSTLLKLKQENLESFFDFIKNDNLKPLEEKLDNFAKEIEENGNEGKWALNEGSDTRFKDMHFCANIILRLRLELLSVCKSGEEWLDACPEWGDKTTYEEIMKVFETDENCFLLNVMSEIYDLFLSNFFNSFSEDDGFISYKMNFVLRDLEILINQLSPSSFIKTNQFLSSIKSKIQSKKDLFVINDSTYQLEISNVETYEKKLKTITKSCKDRFSQLIKDIRDEYNEFPFSYHSCFSFEENNENFALKIDSRMKELKLEDKNNNLESKIQMISDKLIVLNTENSKKESELIKSNDFLLCAKKEKLWWNLDDSSNVKKFALLVHNTPVTSIPVERSFKVYNGINDRHTISNSTSLSQFSLNSTQLEFEEMNLYSKETQNLFRESKKRAIELKKDLKDVIFNLKLSVKKFTKGLNIHKTELKKEDEKKKSKRCVELLNHCYMIGLLQKDEVEKALRVGGKIPKTNLKDGSPKIYKEQLSHLIKVLDPSFSAKSSRGELLSFISSHKKYDEILLKTRKAPTSLLKKRPNPTDSTISKKIQKTGEDFPINEEDFSNDTNVEDEPSYSFDSFIKDCHNLNYNQFPISHPESCCKCQNPITGLLFQIVEENNFLCFNCVNNLKVFEKSKTIVCSNDGARILKKFPLEIEGSNSDHVINGRISLKAHLKELNIWEKTEKINVVDFTNNENETILKELFGEKKNIDNLIEKFKNNGYEVNDDENSFSIKVKDDSHYQKQNFLKDAFQRMKQVQEDMHYFNSEPNSVLGFADIEDGGVDHIIRASPCHTGESTNLKEEGRFLVSIAAVFSNGAEILIECNPGGEDRMGWFWGKRGSSNLGYCDPDHFEKLNITIKDALKIFVFSFIKNKAKYILGHYISVHDMPIIDINIRRFQPFERFFKEKEFETYWTEKLKITTIDTKIFNQSLSTYITGEDKAPSWGVNSMLKLINPKMEEIHNPLLDSYDSLWIFLPFINKKDFPSFANSLISHASSKWSTLRTAEEIHGK